MRVKSAKRQGSSEVETACCCGNEALQQVATAAGARAGSRGHKGPTLPAWALASTRAQTLCGVRPFGRPAGRPLFAHSASPPAPLRCAGPLRRGPPAAASRPRSGSRALASLAGAGPRAFPPALPLGPCAPLRGSAGSRCPRCAWGRPPPAAGFRRCALVALALLRAPRCASRGPAGSPLARPLRGFGPGGFLPRGPARAFGPLLVASGPRGFAARAACGPCFLRRGLPPAGVPVRPRCLRFRAAWVPLRGSQARCLAACRGLRPCFPPAPAAPAGGSRGARGLRPWGLSPPPFGLPFFVAAASAGLDNWSILWYFICARPVPLLRGLPLSGYPWTAGKPLDRKIRRLFSLPCLRRQTRQNHRSDFPEVNQIYGTQCCFFS